MAYVAPERLTLLPFPQAWTDGVLSLRAVVLPRGTPMEPLMTGVPGVDDGPAFADGDIQLEARLISSLSKLPDPNDVTSVKDLGVVSPANRRPLFEAVEAQFVIDPALETATKNPRRAGRQINKLPDAKLYQRLRLRRSTHAVRQTGRRVCLRNATRVLALFWPRSYIYNPTPEATLQPATTRTPVLLAHPHTPTQTRQLRRRFPRSSRAIDLRVADLQQSSRARCSIRRPPSVQRRANITTTSRSQGAPGPFEQALTRMESSRPIRTDSHERDIGRIVEGPRNLPSKPP